MPVSPSSSTPVPAAFSAGGPDEDHHQLARWRDELEARLEERLAHQARHRDQLDDAIDHLEGVRQNLRDRTADLATPVGSKLTRAPSESADTDEDDESDTDETSTKS